MSACSSREPGGERFDHPSTAALRSGKNEEVRTANRKLVDAFLANVPAGVARSIHGMAQPSRCANAEFGVGYDYDVARQEDGLHLSLRVNLKSDPASVSSERDHEMVTTAQACVPKIRKIWSSYGIAFDLDFQSAREPSSASPQWQVEIVDGIGRSNSANYYFQGETSHPVQQEFCLTLLHETGHLIGLDDEYREGKCADGSDQKISTDQNPWSVMDTPFGGWEHAEFFPRHITQIISQATPDTVRWVTNSVVSLSIPAPQDALGYVEVGRAQGAKILESGVSPDATLPYCLLYYWPKEGEPTTALKIPAGTEFAWKLTGIHTTTQGSGAQHYVTDFSSTVWRPLDRWLNAFAWRCISNGSAITEENLEQVLGSDWYSRKKTGEW